MLVRGKAANFAFKFLERETEVTWHLACLAKAMLFHNAA